MSLAGSLRALCCAGRCGPAGAAPSGGAEPGERKREPQRVLRILALSLDSAACSDASRPVDYKNEQNEVDTRFGFIAVSLRGTLECFVPVWACACVTLLQIGTIDLVQVHALG